MLVQKKLFECFFFSLKYSLTSLESHLKTMFSEVEYTITQKLMNGSTWNRMYF